MKLLLTGATGFIGRNLLLAALKDDRYSAIFAPVRSVEKLAAQLHAEGYEQLPAQLKPLAAAAPEWELDGVPQIDHLVHTAGVLHAATRDEFFSTNVAGTVNLLKAVHRPSRAVILSSQAAGGPCLRGTLSRSETDVDAPVSWYGESKLAMERAVAASFADLGYVILRPPMVLGPRDRATLPLLKMARGRIRFKPGYLSKRYTYISVSDLVRAIFAALSGPSLAASLPTRHFYVGSDAPITDRELIATAGRVCGRRGFSAPVPHWMMKVASRLITCVPAWRAALPSLAGNRAREIWPSRWVISSQNFQRHFAWQPSSRLETVLQETHDWYVAEGQL